MNRATATPGKCARCGRAIEYCSFCDGPGCTGALCYQCVGVVIYAPAQLATGRSQARNPLQEGHSAL